MESNAQSWRKRADSLLACLSIEKDISKKIHLLSNASYVFLLQKPDTAFHLSTQAVTLAEASANEVWRADAYTSLSAVYLIRDDNEQTLQYALKALQIAERTRLAPDLMASIHRKLGYVYRNQNEDRKSIDAFKKAIAYSTQARNLYDLAGAASNLGQIFAKIKRTDSALLYHQQALTIARNNNYVDIAVRCFINIVNLHDENENNAAAFALLQEMEPYLSRGELAPIVKGLAYTTIADLDLRKGNDTHLLAQKYLDSMSTLLQYTEPGTENKIDYYLARALLGFSQRDFDGAREALKNFHRYNKIHDDEMIAGHAQDLAVRYETGKKEEQIKYLAEESRLRTLLLGVFIIASLLLLALLFRINQQKKRIRKQEEKLASLLKELHHRVKNNLQIVSSLLSLQSGRAGDTATQQALLEGQHRIEAMSLIHRKLYQTNDVAGVNMPEFITELSESLMQAYGFNQHNFDLRLKMAVQRLDADTAIPLGLILNELLTNAFKYAYNGVAHPQLTVSLSREETRLQLQVSDNGIGINPQQWKDSISFGKQLVHSLAQQLGGQLQVQSKAGTAFIFTFSQKNAA